MDEILIPDVITAIGDAEFEGFVSSTLFSQGWSVTFRALNFQALQEYLARTQIRKTILIYSPDLPGLTYQSLKLLEGSTTRSFGFSSPLAQGTEFPEILDRPQSALELISHMRGNIRAPMLRAPTFSRSQNRRAKVIGVASVTHSAGATTLALNAAFESSLLGKKTLLVDANHLSPSLAILLDERNLAAIDSWRSISLNLFACEATQENIAALMTKIEIALSEFDLIIFDLGSLRGLSNLLSDRRWGSQLIAWCTDYADQILAVTQLETLTLSRIRDFKRDLESTAIKAKVSFVLNSKSNTKRSRSMLEDYSQALGEHYSKLILTMPFDARNVEASRIKKSPLEQVNERGSLRRAIARFAQHEFCS